jgi:hypothetical protein
LKKRLDPLEIDFHILAGSSASKKRRCGLFLEARTTAGEVVARLEPGTIA